jgi:peptidoglycan/LPS O-acetylase OafA/YrhL
MYARTIRNRIVSSKILSDGWVLLLTVLILLLFDANPGFGLGVITNLLLTFCIARVVFIPEGLVGRVLNSAPFVTVGKLSYSLYLWQEFFFKPAGIAPIALPPPFNLAASIAAASVSYWGLEVRFLGLRKKFRNQAQPVLAKT